MLLVPEDCVVVLNAVRAAQLDHFRLDGLHHLGRSLVNLVAIRCTYRENKNQRTKIEMWGLDPVSIQMWKA